MSLTNTLTTWANSTNAEPEITIPVVLTAGKVMSVKIHPNRSRLRIVSGRAWISYEGNDYFLSYGEEMTLPRGKFDAIITALYDKTLVLELLPG